MNRVTMLLGLFAPALAACQPSEGCVEVSRTAVTEPEAPLLIGGTYGDVLATVVGERSGTLAWQPSEQYVRGFPSPGEAGITVTILEPSMAWDVEIEKRARRNERLLCNHWLEGELQIDLETDDGTLDTSVIAPVSLDSPTSARIAAELTDHDLGPLVFDPLDEDASLWLMLSYELGSEAEGALVLSTSSSDDSGNGVGMSADLATWTLE